MRFNANLREAGIDPAACSIVLHTPTEPALRRFLPWMAAERPQLFDAYQSQHVGRAASGITSRRWLASFVGTTPGRLVFAGMFERMGQQVMPVEAALEHPPTVALYDNYATGIGAHIAADRAKGITAWVRFDLRQAHRLSELVGRLVIDQPPGRGYVRIAANLDPAIRALTEHSELVPMPPGWREFVVTAPLLRDLPRDWAARLREWRGVYLIVDQADGARYVGAAYGKDNLLGRWQQHVAADVGVTRELSQRDPAGFRFSVLELVGQATPARDVITCERGWMDRLDTIRYGLNT